LKFQNKGFLLIFTIFVAAHTPRMNCDEMAGNRPTVY